MVHSDFRQCVAHRFCSGEFRCHTHVDFMAGCYHQQGSLSDQLQLTTNQPTCRPATPRFIQPCLKLLTNRSLKFVCCAIDFLIFWTLNLWFCVCVCVCVWGISQLLLHNLSWSLFACDCLICFSFDLFCLLPIPFFFVFSTLFFWASFLCVLPVSVALQRPNGLNTRKLKSVCVCFLFLWPFVLGLTFVDYLYSPLPSSLRHTMLSIILDNLCHLFGHYDGLVTFQMVFHCTMWHLGLILFTGNFKYCALIFRVGIFACFAIKHTHTHTRLHLERAKCFISLCVPLRPRCLQFVYLCKWLDYPKVYPFVVYELVN